MLSRSELILIPTNLSGSDRITRYDINDLMSRSFKFYDRMNTFFKERRYTMSFGSSMDFGSRIIGEIPIFGGIPLTETVVITWFLGIFLVVISILLTRNLKEVPEGAQNVVELIVEAINNLTAQTMGKDKMGFAPYVGSLFVFLAVANILGLIGIRPPTADLNMTFALAALTFVMTHYFGFRRKGLGGYLKSFTEPIPLMLPMNIVGELANPVSLSFRLFGNIIGGVVIMTLAYSGLAAVSGIIGMGSLPILQVGIPIFLHAYFDIFAGLLQSFIFVMLTMVFISMAMD